MEIRKTNYMERHNSPRSPFLTNFIGSLIVLIGMLGLPQTVLGEELTKAIVQSNTPQLLELTIGKSLVLNSAHPIKRASLANPELAETLVLSPTQLYVSGKAMGSTNLTFWGRDGKVFAIYDIEVGPNLMGLKSRIHEYFPEETGIQIRASNDNITLSGMVTGPEVLTQVLQLAEPYAPKKVMSLLQVGGVQQVMLEVKIAEMQRGLLKRFGVNISYLGSDGSFGIGTLGGLSSFDTVNGVLKLLANPATTLSGGFGVGSNFVNLTLDLLKQHDLTKILAEPTLVTVSGQEANFLAGGEFPIPVSQALGAIAIVYKEFGVSLSFNPTVLSGGKMSLKIVPEVSQLTTSSVSLDSISVPGLATRRVETTVELMDGQSFAIAGLIADNVTETIAKYPVLGDLPVLGPLFRSTNFQKNETELIVIVTPRLVKPIDQAQFTLPTDSYLEPNDFEFMIMGYMEGVYDSERGGVTMKQTDETETHLLIPQGGGLEGQFGHLAP
jgi:pilus assembly protein CpaC